MSNTPVQPPLPKYEAISHAHTVYRLIGDVAALRQDSQRLKAEMVTLALKLDNAVGANKELAAKMDEVINAFMLHQGRTALAMEKPIPASPVLLRVQDRAHFSTSPAPQQPRIRKSPLFHGTARLSPFKELADDPIDDKASNSSA